MCCVLLLILTSHFAVTVSQVQITANKINVKDGESVVLTCTVPDFTDNIIVIQGTSTNRALCFANSPCSSTDNSAYSVTKSGTNVIFTILSFLKTRDVGDWFVRYGTMNDSLPVELSEFTQNISTTDEFGAGAIFGIVFGGLVCLIAIVAFVLYIKGLFCFATVRATVRKPAGKPAAIKKEVIARAGSEINLLPELKSIVHIESVTWTRAGKTVKTENELMHQDGTIPCVSPKDSGLWHCNLIFENGNEKIFVIRLNVIVYQYEADKGTRVQLLDYIKKSQSFQDVQWYHGKLKISGNELKYQGGTKEVPSLYVGRLEDEDAGEYTCEILFQNAVLEIPVKLAVKSQSDSSLPPLRTSGLTTSTS